MTVTKMHNIAGISTTESQKASDLFMKCQYLDEITGARGVTFATGTPISNSMTELYTMQRYLQQYTLERNGLANFDSWAATFGETVTAIELAPEGYKPEIVNVPKANYIAVRGKGNPNEEGGAYQQASSILYAVAYTLKMSYKTDYKIEGFFEYVVPPLEGFWWQDDVESVDYTNKSAFSWISVIRLPDFISKADFDWAVETTTKKKKLDCSSAEYLTLDEGLDVYKRQDL